MDKVFASFAYPLGLAIGGLLLALLCALLGARRTGIIAAFLLTIMLWAASTPIVARALLSTLEAQYPAHAVEGYGPADVAIVLGGALRPPNHLNPYPDLAEASDRVLHAYRIVKAGRVRKILLSGGNLFGGPGVSEAETMAEVLMSLGIDREAILIEGESRNTHENAVASFKIWRREGFSSGLLVTSAFHMPRALAVFRKQGLALEPVATDLMAEAEDLPFPLSVLPNADSLAATTKALREWIGLYVYRWRGWA